MSLMVSSGGLRGEDGGEAQEMEETNCKVQRPTAAREANVDRSNTCRTLKLKVSEWI